MSSEVALRFHRPEPDKWLSATLAVLVHAFLATLLVLGVHWQSHAPEAVEVELYPALPKANQPAPKAEPLPPEPAKAEPPPRARQEPPPPVKPDIARKAKPEKPVAPDWSKELKATEQNLRRQKDTEAAAKQLQDIKASQAASSLARARGAWGDKIRAAIRRHIVLPPNVGGNPEAVFEVSLLPDGTVLANSIRQKKPTGNPALDAAIERAIAKASPLPKPDDPNAFQRDLELKFRPLED